MARRIEIELTSARPDGTWTWRAAGALQPRGVLDGDLLFEGAKAGDVVRVDAEFEMDGITITAVLPPKDKKRAEPQRLEVLGPAREQQPGVTANLAPRSDRRRSEGPARTPRRTGDSRPGQTGRPSGDRAPRDAARSGDRPAPARGGRPAREGRPREGGAREGGAPAAAPRQQARTERAEQPRTERRTRQTGRDGAGRSDAASRAEDTARPKARRLNPGSAHRTAVLESLAPEQRPVAEQVLRGGIPAVRTALHLEREKAAAEGRPAPNAEALLSMAEDLLPRLRAAEWRDRAEAASKVADEIALRDLRSVVTGADVARDEEGRRLAATLREALERRVNGLRDEWLADVRTNLEEGRIVRALRLSGRPPDPGTRFPAEIANQLADAAAQALAPDTPPDRWLALLEAVAVSPVRRTVKPAGLPADPPEELLQAARQSSGRIPALAALLGIPMPPPPGPVRPAGRSGRGGGRPPRPGRPSGPSQAGSSSARPRSIPSAASPAAGRPSGAGGSDTEANEASAPTNGGRARSTDQSDNVATTGQPTNEETASSEVSLATPEAAPTETPTQAPSPAETAAIEVAEGSSEAGGSETAPAAAPEAPTERGLAAEAAVAPAPQASTEAASPTEAAGPGGDKAPSPGVQATEVHNEEPQQAKPDGEPVPAQGPPRAG